MMAASGRVLGASSTMVLLSTTSNLSCVGEMVTKVTSVDERWWFVVGWLVWSSFKITVTRGTTTTHNARSVQTARPRLAEGRLAHAELKLMEHVALASVPKEQPLKLTTTLANSPWPS